MPRAPRPAAPPAQLLSEMEALRRAQEELERRVAERTAELRQANADLSAEIEQRARLESQLLAVSEHEKRRFGQALHDETCQSLAGLAMHAAVLARRLKKDGEETAPELKMLAAKLNELVEGTRRIAHGLHPVGLGGGLAPALEELVEMAGAKVRCTLQAAEGGALPAVVELALYRIAQEALDNALEHSKATRVCVRLRRGRQVVLTIEDNGVGLTPRQLQAPAGRAGMGLDIMGYRAHTIGAQLAVENLPAGGLRVSCLLAEEAARSADGR